MTSVNQTRPHCVNQMGKIHSKPLAPWHGRGTAWARHAMCESALRQRSLCTYCCHRTVQVPSEYPKSHRPLHTPIVRASQNVVYFDFKHIYIHIYIYIYRVCINYRRTLQNRISTNTEQKYMMLLPFERGMFAVS